MFFFFAMTVATIPANYFTDTNWGELSVEER
jgi:hypothetical protein